jgi:hypothetical protein
MVELAFSVPDDHIHDHRLFHRHQNTRLSRIERREERGTQAASTLRLFTPNGLPTMLFVGNSLLLEGVDLDSLRDNLASQYTVSRFAIE